MTGPQRMSVEELRATQAAAAGEEALQITIADYLRRCIPAPPAGPVWTAVNPLPGFCSPALGARRKAMGLQAGWPDIQLLWRRRPIFVELKVGRGDLSPEQQAVIADLRAEDAIVEVVRSLEEFRQLLALLGIPTRERAR